MNVSLSEAIGGHMGSSILSSIVELVILGGAVSYHRICLIIEKESVARAGGPEVWMGTTWHAKFGCDPKPTPVSRRR